MNLDSKIQNKIEHIYPEDSVYVISLPFYFYICLLNNIFPGSMNDANDACVYLHSCIQITLLCCFTVVLQAAFGQNLKSLGGASFWVFFWHCCVLLHIPWKKI